MYGFGSVLAVVCAIGAVASGTAVADPTRGGQVDLRPENPAFWQTGPLVVEPGEALTGDYLAGWTHELNVAPAGRRLRVAMDLRVGGVRQWTDGKVGTSSRALGLGTSGFGSRFVLELRDPDGHVVAAEKTNGYSREVFVEHPVAGIYTMKVRPQDPSELAAAVERSFRDANGEMERVEMHLAMRAKLEAAAEKASGALLPNLRIVPPFELNFGTPTTTYGPAFVESALGGAPPSCMAEEYEEETAQSVLAAFAGQVRMPAAGVRCLRFSAGFENVGEGPLAVDLPDPVLRTDVALSDIADWPATQRIYTVGSGFSNGPEGSAGTGRFHLTHGHWHYENMYTYELFRADDHDRAHPIRAGKRGVNPGDELIAQWDRFVQCPAAKVNPPKDARCGYGHRDASILLGTGWGDIYEYNRSGQAVLFPTDAAGLPLDGRYVLVGTADREGKLLETDDTDNSSYTLFEVKSGRITVLESGLGSGPV